MCYTAPYLCVLHCIMWCRALPICADPQLELVEAPKAYQPVVLTDVPSALPRVAESWPDHAPRRSWLDRADMPFDMSFNSTLWGLKNVSASPADVSRDRVFLHIPLPFGVSTFRQTFSPFTNSLSDAGLTDVESLTAVNITAEYLRHQVGMLLNGTAPTHIGQPNEPAHLLRVLDPVPRIRCQVAEDFVTYQAYQRAWDDARSRNVTFDCFQNASSLACADSVDHNASAWHAANDTRFAPLPAYNISSLFQEPPVIAFSNSTLYDWISGSCDPTARGPGLVQEQDSPGFHIGTHQLPSRETSLATHVVLSSDGYLYFLRDPEWILFRGTLCLGLPPCEKSLTSYCAGPASTDSPPVSTELPLELPYPTLAVLNT